MPPVEPVFPAGSWRKSSYSGSQVESECVEVARGTHLVGVRDTKDRDGGALFLTVPAWRGLTERV